MGKLFDPWRNVFVLLNQFIKDIVDVSKKFNFTFEFEPSDYFLENRLFSCKKLINRFSKDQLYLYFLLFGTLMFGQRIYFIYRWNQPFKFGFPPFIKYSI